MSLRACCRLQELKSTAVSLLVDAVFDDPWTNALTQCLAARDYVRVCRRSVLLQEIMFGFVDACRCHSSVDCVGKRSGGQNEIT